MQQRHLNCLQCKWSERLGPAEMLTRLQKIGMLRRDGKPADSLLEELFSTALGRLTCDACGQAGLTIETHEWQDDWGTDVRCERCRQVIDPERLEVFPDTKVCPSCQRKSEQGDHPQTVEYCRNCGGVMVMRRRSGPSLAGYRMVCADCGKNG